MYLIGLPIAYCFVYLILFLGLPLFFTGKFGKLHRGCLVSVVTALLVYLAIFVLSMQISDVQLANRVLHALGGGSLVVFICFLCIRDSKVKVNAFQFFVVAIAVATVFGVANEIMEFMLQNYLGLVFADSINDTWLDLISNGAGALLAALALAPFVRTKDEK